MNLHSFLLVDIGNSRVKWAVADIPGFIDGVLDSRSTDKPSVVPRVSGELPTVEVTLEYVKALSNKFSRHYLVLASVVPRLVPLFSRAFKKRFHLVTAQSPALGLHFDYPNPAEIGADRLAAAVAVLADGIWPVVVVNCGTATAFTVLNDHGHLCGGVIAPGLQTQLAALIGATAQLPATELRSTRRYLAKSTGDAIRAGVMLNFQGGVKEILQRLSEALPEPPLVVLTGGNASHLAGTLRGKAKFRPLLVFEGLRMIGMRAFIEGV